jgi:ribokinase
MKTDILAIGDIDTDAFINLIEKDEHTSIDKQNRKLIFDFGEKIPYEYAMTTPAVGNAGNVAVSSSRLGLNSALLSYIGDDQNGRDCLEELKKNNVGVSAVRTESGKSTNYNYVLWYDVDRTILTKHEKFSYQLGEIEPAKFIYLTSLGENSLDFQNQIADFVEKNPETRLAFQPGTFQIRAGATKLSKIYKQTEIFFCNVEEAQEILKTESRDLPTLLSDINKLGPKIVVITDGISGAYAFDGAEMWFVPIYPGNPPFERTGAGDAFSSTVVASLALGESLQTALLWAPINSMSVTLFVGAQKGLLSQEKIKEFLDKAPDNYKLQKINLSINDRQVDLT